MEKIIVISKIVLLLSALTMVISLGLVAFDTDYGILLIVGVISGVIFILADIIVAVDAITQLMKKVKNNR